MSSVGEPLGGTREAILERLFAFLKDEVPDVAADPALFDPALRMLFKALAVELEVVHQEIGRAEDRALEALLRRLLAVPRSAAPAQTVVQFVAAEPGLQIDPEAIALGATVTITGKSGQPTQVPLEFRPREAVTLGKHAIVATLHVDAAGRAELVPTPAASAGDAKRQKIRPWQTQKPARPLLLFCIEERVPSPPRPGPRLFVDGPDTAAVDAVLWGRWRPVGRGAAVGFGDSWTPARWVARGPQPMAYDVLGFRADMPLDGGPYARRFVNVPLPDEAKDVLPDLVRESGVSLPVARGSRWWWRVELAGDPFMDTSGARVHADCVPVANIHLQTKGEMVPDLRQQSIVLPVGFDELTEVRRVLDVGTGVTYRHAERLSDTDGTHLYILRLAPDGRRVAVHLRNPARGFESSRIDVHYATTAGADGNNIGPSALEIVQRLPGLRSATNLVESRGGRPALGPDEAHEEIRSALRHHGRAVTAQDYRDLAIALGGEFASDVQVDPGVLVTPQGAVRCVDVRVLAKKDFTSEIEKEAYRRELEYRLEQRAPLGTRVRVILPGAQFST